MQLIRAKTCRNCKFSRPIAETKDWLECRRYPPNFGPVVVPISPGAMAVQIHGGPGRVSPDYDCGEHVHGIAAVADESPIPQAAFDQMKLMGRKAA